VLNLSYNFISDVNNRWLQGLDGLQVLDMTSNNVSNLEENAFTRLQALQRLILGKNKLSVVLPTSLSGLNSSLHCLDLSLNKISLLNNGVFGALRSLTLLNLAGNKLEALRGQCFHGLTSLQQLDVSENQISSVDEGVFSELNNLQRLNLSGNRLEALTDQCFGGLTHLQQLDVSRNRISSVSPGTFQSVGGLTELILADNPVLGRLRQELMMLVGTGGRLQTVDVSRSGLTQVPAALTRSIRTLQLAGNSVTTVRCGDLDSYPLLQLLNLADNQIGEMEEDALGRLEVLSTLYLSGNRLLTVPRSLPSGLVTLHLQRNRIQELNSGDLQGLPRLKYLSLCCSDISTVRNGAFSQLTALQTLDISENPLKSLPGNALSGPLMTVLRLSHLGDITSSASDTTEMSFPVTSPERLEVLELDSSPVLARQLLADTAALAAFRQLRVLSLVDTGLTNLRSDLFHFLPRLRTLRLNGNPWECEGMLWLANWIRRQQKYQKQQLETSLHDAYCASPPHLVSTPVIHLRDTDFNITTSSTGPPGVLATSVESDAYESTTEARYGAPFTSGMLSVLRILNTQVPDNRTLPAEDPYTSADLTGNQTPHKPFTKYHPAHFTEPFNDTSSSTPTFNTVETSPVNVPNTLSTVTESESSSSANDEFIIPSITASEEFIFNTTTIYEADLITNIHSTDSPVTDNMTDNEDDFSAAPYTDTTSGSFHAVQVPNKTNIYATFSPPQNHTMTFTTGGNTKETQIILPTTLSLKPHLKEMNNTVHGKKRFFTEKNSIQRNEKSSYHLKNVTTIQNQSISSNTAIKTQNTNPTNYETRSKIHTNIPSNSTRTLFTNKPWTQHKFFPNPKNKEFLPSTEPLPGVHDNLNVHKIVLHTMRNDRVLNQTFSNKNLQKFKHYQDKSFNNIMQGDESVTTTTDHNSNPMEAASLFNKTLQKHTFNSPDLTNQSAHIMESNYHMVMKHEHTNMSTNHSNLNSTIKVQSPLYSSVHNSAYRNSSAKTPIGFYTNKLKLVERHSSESLEKVATGHGNATSSGMNNSGNITYTYKTHGRSDNATEQSPNKTSTLDGENLVFENVTLATGEKSVFYSSHASDAFASGVHVTVKENIPTSLLSGSHPSMFVLLGVGLAMAGALAMAVSHCAKRRRRLAVEYSRQQDIEVRSMSSIGDLW
jgi:Leucine-rich repeat (LRR) protein